MAPVAPLLASLLALASLSPTPANATPLAPGRHMAPQLYNKGIEHARRGLGKVLSRYYGDSQGLPRPPTLEAKRARILPAGWSNFGCVEESYDQRLLQGSSFSSSQMTPVLCATQCQSAGFSLAATEYTDECYCGNQFIGSGGHQQDPSRCGMPCSGDPSELCGAAWFLNVYQFNGTSCTTGTTPSVSPSPTTSPSATTTSPGGTASPSSTLSTRNNTLDSSEWYVHGCAVDSNDRLLTGWSDLAMHSLSVDSCLQICEERGFKFGGVEYGEQCYCGNTIPSQIHFDSALCGMPCSGNARETCGGFWGMELFELLSGENCPVTTTGAGGAPATTNIGNEQHALPTARPTTTTALTVSPSPTGAPQPTAAPPSTNGQNQVWAHHMVGNAYPYQVSDWLTDIRLAKAAGIDGFALNIGTEQWQTDRSADAYAAAQQSGLDFKMFFSLDMTSLGCWSGADAQRLVSIVARFASHPNQAWHNGKVLVSTFAGSDCHFGTSQGSNAWQGQFVDPLRNQGVNIFFVPSIFSDISTFSSNTWMDGELNWNSAWPMGNNQISTDTDVRYMNALGSKEYMGAVSPFFYTHFGPSSWNKNWLYRSDDWLYCARWEQLIGMRDRVRQVEILTWNDFGESSYISPIHGALPANSGDWVNGMDHQGLNVLTAYYAAAYKTGVYPAITRDSLVVWTRPHPFNANSGDSVAKPTGWDWTTDFVWAVVLATGDASVTLTSGSNTQTFSVGAGLTKLKIPNAPGGVSGSISRGGSQTASLNIDGFQFTTTPQTYNYNYIVKASS